MRKLGFVPVLDVEKEGDIRVISDGGRGGLMREGGCWNRQLQLGIRPLASTTL